jgi:hypothetical protein
MEKGIFEKTSVLAAVLAAGAFAVEPNYVASTIFNVNGEGHSDENPDFRYDRPGSV